MELKIILAVAYPLLSLYLGAFNGWLWHCAKVQCGLRSERSERLAGAKGASGREQGLPTLCESGRERSEFVGAETLARASTGGQANLFAGRACGCGVSAPHLIAVALHLSKGLACYLQSKLLLSNFNGNFIHF